MPRRETMKRFALPLLMVLLLACAETGTPTVVFRLKTATPTASPTTQPSPTASATSSAPSPPSIQTHLVQPGETLGEIARQYGVSLETLVAANDIADPGLIQVGQELVIPSPGAIATLTPTRPALARETAQVAQVIDGDTIEVELGGQRYRVRYIGMDTPEVGEPFYAAATEANRRLVQGQVVEMEKDVSETDRYGRLLRYVYVGNVMVNEELIRLGMAKVATFPPDVEYAERFLIVQEEAQAEGVGLWGVQ
jgi:micrococcal nuclease